MRKRTDKDWVKQRISSIREEKSKSNPKYDPRRVKTPIKLFGRKVIFAPQSISFFNENYNKFQSFIRNIEKEAQTGKILLDLQRTKEIKAAGMLVLYAAIEQAQKTSNTKTVIKTTKCNSRKISQAFKKFGVWELTREERNRPKYNDSDQIAICTASIDNDRKISDAQLKEVIKYTQRAIENSGIEDQGDLAFAAITESVSNVGLHAYDDAYFKKEHGNYLKN